MYVYMYVRMYVCMYTSKPTTTTTIATTATTVAAINNDHTITKSTSYNILNHDNFRCFADFYRLECIMAENVPSV